MRSCSRRPVACHPTPMRWLPWLLLVALAGSINPAAAQDPYPMSEALTRDRDALLGLQQRVASAGWGTSLMRRWKGNPCEPIVWPHITCEQLPDSITGLPSWRVVSLDLTNQDVLGTLNANLGLLTAARNISLEGNRFSGPLPQGWASGGMFKQLQVLNLRNNKLDGPLPNQWNLPKGWRSLTTLDLSSNRFVGGLPRSWLGTKKVFRALRYLDLSNNRLGLREDGTQFTASDDPDGWCQQGEASTGLDGWCPTTPVFPRTASKMPSLVSLDVSNNRLQGALPSKWGRIFPKLQYLLIHSNSLYSEVPGVAQPLPISWTRQTLPLSFQTLQMLVAFPGNDLICQLPATTDDGGEGWTQLQGDAGYQVVDQSFNVFDATSPRRCPAPAGGYKTMQGSAVLSLAADGAVTITWPAPTTTDPVFGFVVSLTLADMPQISALAAQNRPWGSSSSRASSSGTSGTTAAAAAAAVNATRAAGRAQGAGFERRLYRIYQQKALPDGLSLADGIYTLTPGLKADGTDLPPGSYRATVAVVYLDGGVSLALSSTSASPFVPSVTNEAADITSGGTLLTFSWSYFGGVLPQDAVIYYSIARWSFGRWGYTLLGNGTLGGGLLPLSVTQLVDSPADGDSFRIRIRTTAPGYTRSVSRWWAVLSEPGIVGGSWSVSINNVGPQLAAPVLASVAVNYPPTMLTLRWAPIRDVPWASVTYAVSQVSALVENGEKQIAGGAVPPSASVQASIEQAGGDAAMEPGDYFLVRAAIEVEGYTSSEIVQFRVGERLDTPTLLGSLNGAKTTLTLSWDIATFTAATTAEVTYTVTQFNSGADQVIAESTVSVNCQAATACTTANVLVSVQPPAVTTGDYFLVSYFVNAAGFTASAVTEANVSV